MFQFISSSVLETIATSEKNSIIATDNWQDFVEIISYWKEWG
jgi:hypothetical protein